MILNLQHLKCESATFDPKIKPQGLQALLHQSVEEKKKQTYFSYFLIDTFKNHASHSEKNTLYLIKKKR